MGIRGRPTHSRFLALLAVLVAAALACSARGAGAMSYVALGDSIAVGAGDGGGGGYVARYRNHLAADFAAAVVLQNLGVGGTTSQDLLTSLTARCRAPSPPPTSSPSTSAGTTS